MDPGIPHWTFGEHVDVSMTTLGVVVGNPKGGFGLTHLNVRGA